jgi:hypothetical protein
MDQFLAGFALVQMLPGPLFNMSAYIGAVYLGWRGALTAWVGLFLPGFLLVIALLPLWDRVRKVRHDLQILCVDVGDDEEEAEDGRGPPRHRPPPALGSRQEGEARG